MKKLPADLLDRPAPEGACSLALVRLRSLILERKRLDDADDSQALHDFRVALRRLRSILRAYRSVLGDSVSSKIRRRLSRLAEASGVCRDAEVRLQWISEIREESHPADAPGLAWVERHLRRERRAGDRILDRELKRHFTGLARRLRSRLMRHCGTRKRRETPAVPAMREVMSQTLLELTSTLRERLDEPTRAGGVRALHLARIASKRLRYVLEPLAEGRFASPRDARVAVRGVTRLASLQGELGKINDARLFKRWLRDRIADDSPLPAPLNAELRGVRRLLDKQAATSYASVRRPASRRRLDAVLRAIQESAKAMVPQRPSGDTFRA
jgi:CHAD domain-containing protein